MTRLPLLAVAFLSAVPAQAAELWPVQADGGSCSMVQTFQDEEFGRQTLRVGYDAARQEVTIASTNGVGQPLDASGEVVMKILFLDNGDQKLDEGWPARRFAYTRAGDAYRFSAAVSGEINVRQFLADLANSGGIGFRQGRDIVAAYDLADAGPSIAKLRDCAARAVAAN